jgi:hypothetical protein
MAAFRLPLHQWSSLVAEMATTPRQKNEQKNLN